MYDGFLDMSCNLKYLHAVLCSRPTVHGTMLEYCLRTQKIVINLPEFTKICGVKVNVIYSKLFTKYYEMFSVTKVVLGLRDLYDII